MREKEAELNLIYVMLDFSTMKNSGIKSGAALLLKLAEFTLRMQHYIWDCLTYDCIPSG
jgi:hypothetical protein